MAWELPSKPVYLDNLFGNEAQMEKVSLLENRVDRNSSSKVPYRPNIPRPNIYYTNIPANSGPPVYPNSFQRYPVQSNKIQHYLSYADRVMSELQYLNQNAPSDQPLSPATLGEFANA